MKKYDDTLFKIGDVIKIMGITRKTLIVYEDMGLLTPAVKDNKSGYRYYSADNMTQIRAIRSLQSLGLTLKEVQSYYYDTENIDIHLQRLMELRASLDKNIQMLQVRAAKPGDLTVHKVTLPQLVCYCRRYDCNDVAEASNNLRDTYIDVARTGKMYMPGRMFTMRMSPSPDKLDLMCCIPVTDDFEGPERIEFPETPALCIYYRGPYEESGIAIRALMQYVKENNIEVAGPFRSVYMEGPPNRGKKKEDYITQIAVPIKI
ncbi:MAG: MerR family transcriptional regulator [Oscillospiraceae bacterium]|nr:MerR family transcriptional regulator [Oscillospiraceae bacterium]